MDKYATEYVLKGKDGWDIQVRKNETVEGNFSIEIQNYGKFRKDQYSPIGLTSDQVKYLIPILQEWCFGDEHD